jgi:integrase
LSGELKELLGPQVKVVTHHPAMPYAEVPDFMVKLRSRDSLTARALEWTVLNAVRAGDTLGARWSEIDTTARTWTIGRDRLKGRIGGRKSDHTVPLSDAAVRLLELLPRVGDRVFPLSAGAMDYVLKTLAPDCTTHGFRSSFKDWSVEQTEYPNELSELALAHKVGSKVEQAYRRSDMVEKRRAMMADWAAHCGGFNG